MKNMRIQKLKQSKRIKKATKVLTVGLLVCPLTIGLIKALADEAETIPSAEQVEEIPVTTEEIARVEETEASESVQPEESFTADELDLINARKVLAQLEVLDPYNYTEESWNKMIELDSLGEIYGASGSLRMLCEYPDNQIIKGSKDKIQLNVYVWTDRLTEAMKVLVKVDSGETPLQQSIAKLKHTITSAESKLTESGYTPQNQ
ncbi:hypothetical protein ACSFB8_00810 [Enterococcus faecalis]